VGCWQENKLRRSLSGLKIEYGDFIYPAERFLNSASSSTLKENERNERINSRASKYSKARKGLLELLYR
jgi:hypothetical protein